MRDHESTLELPPWYRWRDAVRYWGRDPRSAQERAQGDRIRWALTVPDGPGASPEPGGPVALEAVHGPGGRVRARAVGDVLEVADHRAWVEAALRRLLGLHLDPPAFEDRLRGGEHERLVTGRPGLTIPQTATVFDGAVWVICGQQVSLPVAFTMRRRLAQSFGRPALGFSEISGVDSAQAEAMDGLFAPPRPADLAAVEVDALAALGLSRRKAEYLIGFARRLTEGFDPESLRGAPPAEVEAELLAIRGFGPWSVHYLMMRALGFEDQVPVGDAGLARALVSYYGLDERPGPERTLELMAPFAPYRSLATFHLWAAFA